jgi:hypothetical protein
MYISWPRGPLLAERAGELPPQAGVPGQLAVVFKGGGEPAAQRCVAGALAGRD